MSSRKFELARQYAEGRLERELSPILSYHWIGHTRDEVVPAAEMLAGMEGLRGESLTLLLTAAWFHDLGYVEQPRYHELISARIAVQILPSFGYSKKQVEIVRSAILATALPQLPHSLLEEILTDADLLTLGRESFRYRNTDLRAEFAALGREYTDREWYLAQVEFLERHSYFTASAHSLADAQKLINIAAMRKALEATTEGGRRCGFRWIQRVEGLRRGTERLQSDLRDGETVGRGASRRRAGPRHTAGSLHAFQRTHRVGEM